MTVFKDRLARTIRIKKRFAPSSERLRIAGNRFFALLYMLLAVVVAALLFHWLAN
jgi:hypothetical protein